MRDKTRGQRQKAVRRQRRRHRETETDRERENEIERRGERREERRREEHFGSMSFTTMAAADTVGHPSENGYEHSHSPAYSTLASPDGAVPTNDGEKRRRKKLSFLSLSLSLSLSLCLL
jgi:hypothetical protein